MTRQIGWLMQLFVLGALPGMIVYELTYGFEKIQMPVCLLTGCAIFMIGTKLRRDS